MPKRGLPGTVRMRHDEHYVEALTSSAGAPIGRMVGIDQIDANPNQPRQVMGDLSELMASIAEKGIIEPLIVRQRGSRYQIVAGERRYQASVQVGLRELPVVIRDATSTVGAAFMREIERQLAQDIPIWENKVYVNPPLICDGDGPIGLFRRWVKQFYADSLLPQAPSPKDMTASA